MITGPHAGVRSCARPGHGVPHSRAGIFLFVTLLTVSACGDDEPAAPPEPRRIVGVEIRPRSTSLAIADSLRLTAVVWDDRGDTLQAPDLTWESRDTTIATVSPLGWVTGRNQGVTTVVAVSGGRTAGATITVEPKVADQTIVVDSSQAELISDSSEVASGRLVFRGSRIPEVEEGAVIVGSQNGGFLRRVTEVVQNSDSIVLKTEFAALTEAIEHGSFQTSTNIGLSDPGLARTSPTDFRRDVSWTATEVTYLVEGASISSAGLNLGRTILLDRDGLRAEVLDAMIDFSPQIALAADIGFFEVKHFRAVASGALSVQATLSVEASTEINASVQRKLVSIQKGFYGQIGPVPVAGQVELLLVAHLALTTTGTASSRATLSGHAETVLGAEYKEESWSPEFNISSEFAPFEPSWSSTATAQARLEVRPILRLNLYGVAGPSIQAVPYLEMAGEGNTSACSWAAKLDGGLDAALVFDVRVLGLHLAEFERTFSGPRSRLFDGGGSVAYDLTLVSGDDQTAPALSLLPEPLVVRVTGPDGDPKEGVAVNFEVAEGYGIFLPASMSTGGDGTAGAQWALGPPPGVQSGRVEAAACPGRGAAVEALASERSFIWS